LDVEIPSALDGRRTTHTPGEVRGLDRVELGGHLVGGAVQHDPAPLHEVDAVGDPERLADVLLSCEPDVATCRPMRFGLDVAQQRMSWDEVVRRVQLAEELGFEGAWGFDHLQPMYGEGPGETFEGMTMLAALAGVTSRIRLGLLVTGVTYRHPSVFAAQALTVDHASHGRLDLSLGAAWFDKEHHELGIPFPPLAERYALLEDALEIVTRLFSGEAVSYDGHAVSLRDARLRPVPVQRPHPPIWIGGSGPRRTLPIVAKYADAWHAFGSPNSLRDVSERLDQLAVDAGREPSAILRAGSLSLDDLDTARRHAAKWRDAGYGYLVCEWPSAGADLVERFARDVMPEFAD
jgi:alkanesulfonate monooxygenase SsuD/methylene tetrahydromethanopterin reductase-like flavin-dependent oxidoreductase (luciferase family)